METYSAIVVDTEEQFDIALAARDSLGNGQEIYLRGEGSDGRIKCTKEKLITGNKTIINGPAELVFTAHPEPGVIFSAIHIAADDCSLSDFKLTSTMSMDDSELLYGITFPDDSTKGHRTRIQGMEIHNWNRCISKDGGIGDTTLDDVLILDCYLHTFKYTGLFLSFGVRRLTVQRFRSLGSVGDDKHISSGNGVVCGTNIYDLHFIDCEVGNTGHMGIELIVANYSDGKPTSKHHRTRLERVYAHDCGWFGISLGHCKDGIVRDCVVKNVHWIGIEYSAQLDDPSYGQIINPVIDGVMGDESTKPAVGISIDKVTRTQVYGGTIRNMDPKGIGLQFWDSTWCSVRDMEFVDAGIKAIQAARNLNGPTIGYNSVEGCLFYHPNPIAPYQYAIYVYDQPFVARNNTSFQKQGFGLHFVTNHNPGGGGVWSEQMTPIGAGDFSQSGTQPGAQSNSSNYAIHMAGGSAAQA